MYNERVLKEFENPQNVGELEDANGIGTVGNASCGDIMKIFLKIEDNIIKDVSFKTFGCTAAIVTSSVATTMIKGKTVEEALKLTNKQVVDALGGLPAQKLHCSVLAEEAIKSAINDYLTKYKQDLGDSARQNQGESGGKNEKQAEKTRKRDKKQKSANKTKAK